jgi:hypothetical protein
MSTKKQDNAAAEAEAALKKQQEEEAALKKQQEEEAAAAAVKKDTITLYAPNGITGCSANGNQYEVIDGSIEVLEADASLLIEHGFSTSKSETENEDNVN